MRHSFVLAIALSSLLFKSIAFEYESTSFTQTPVQVLSTSDTTHFKYPFVSRFLDSNYIALWGFYGDSDTAPITYKAYRRLLNATDLSVAGYDTDITLNITLISTPLFASSTDGYVAIAGVVNASTTTTTTNSSTNITTNITTNTTSIVVYVFKSDADEPSEIRAINIETTDTSADDSLSYTPHKLWFQDDYFYLLYAQSQYNVDYGLYLQAFERKSGDLKWASPAPISTNSLSGNANAQAAQQGDLIVCSWRRETEGQVVSVVVNMTDSDVAVTTDETVIATDSGTSKFAPTAAVYTESYYVIVLSQSTDGATTGFSVSFSGSNVTDTLGFALDTNYTTYSVSVASTYYNGWFVITRQSAESGTTITGTEETLQLYNYTSTASTNTSNTTNTTDTNTTDTTNTTTTTSNNTEFILVTDGSIIQGFTLPNQSYYVLILDSLDGQNGTWTAGYIGQVFTKISDSTWGAALKAVLGFVSTIIAFLLIF